MITGLIGLLLVATAVVGVWWTVTRTDYIPKLVAYLIKSALPIFLKLFVNRPKTPEEWAEWRRLSLIKPSEMSPTERARFRELKKLNSEFRKNK